jgi:hypothetical protein
VGSAETVRSLLLQLMDAGADSLYISVETARHGELAVAVAEMLSSRCPPVGEQVIAGPA